MISGTPRNQAHIIRSVLCFGIPFGVYVLTLAPTVYNLDSAELTTAAATLGLTRATGYPLYILVGHLWSHLPAGDVGFRMNLFSAFQGALAIALIERILQKLDVSIWASLGVMLATTTIAMTAARTPNPMSLRDISFSFPG